MARILKPGVFCPVLTFFQPDTEDLGMYDPLSRVTPVDRTCLDLEAFQRHLLHVTKAGVGPVIAGSNGEAIHLSHEERVTLIHTARRTLDAAGLTDVSIIAGTGAHKIIKVLRQVHHTSLSYT